MNTEKLTDNLVLQFLTSLSGQCEKKISQEGIDLVRHYLRHDEFAMAFEVLFLELIEFNYLPEQTDIETWKKIGLHLGLDAESVIDSTFWPKFIEFIEAQKDEPK